MKEIIKEEILKFLDGMRLEFSCVSGSKDFKDKQYLLAKLLAERIDNILDKRN